MTLPLPPSSSDLPIDPRGSMTRWIEQLRSGDRLASSPSQWNNYFAKLSAIASHRLAKMGARPDDGEDVAAVVMATFCQKIANGKFPDVRDRDDLWKLLVHIAKRQVVNQMRRNQAQFRGGGRVMLATDIQVMINDKFNLNEVPDGEPTLESVIAFEDTCRYFVEKVLRMIP